MFHMDYLERRCGLDSYSLSNSGFMISVVAWMCPGILPQSKTGMGALDAMVAGLSFSN